ncbi:hypothetical protein [Shewanella sp. 10N.286.48.A6]|uniref:hypothetical protein n=1 Tax=Shewanella sp. 10N.286.48.A6 TaxID=1880833 RepID=UPI000C847558|nr:hypothetical protein [Shewanella sp. 10N.286.48.A6]PMH96275.1 hypothetical protein BCU55_19430 [Shewanella sp. 10N.286.48.A6]
MNSIFATNYSIYESIAREAFQDMKDSIDSGRRPKPDGSEGWIITYDPTHTSFKSAMVSVVFTGMWLEAILHLEIVKRFDESKFKEYDFKPYEEKLKLIGIEDADFLNRISRFRKSRKELVHEKANFDSGEIKTAQSEADNAFEIRNFLIEYLS